MLKPLRSFVLLIFGLAVGLASLVGGCAQTTPIKPQWPVTTLEGKATSIRFEATTKAVVFEFLSVECPISNRVEPELERLEREYSARGIRFVAIYPNAGDTPDIIRQHRAAGSLAPEAFRDPNLTLTDALAVKVTPEVVVIAADGQQVYRGRINDQYAALGQGRPAPTRHDLAEALSDFIAGNLKEPRVSAPVGCRVQRTP